MKFIGVRRLLFAIGLAFVCSGAAAVQAANCVPIDYLKPPMNTATLYLKTDKNYNQPVLIYKGGNSPWSVKVVSGSLPPGMTLKVVPFTGGYALDGYSGDIYLVGQPTAEGDYFPKIQLTDSCPNGVQTKTSLLQLQTRCGQLKFSDSINLPPAVLGKSYSFQFKTSCDPKYESQGFLANQSTLPPGLNISDTGLLSGTATKPSTYNVSVSAMTYGANNQNTGPKLFPLQVIDNIPPTLTFFDVTNKLISYQGGKTDVIVKVSDNGLLRLPQITLTSPDGTQWRYVAGLKSGTYTNGEFQATVTLPANNKNTDVIYKLNGVVEDTAGNKVTCPTRIITVSKIPTRIPTTQDSQGSRVTTQPNIKQPVQRIPAK
jgi:hypothetical protein